MEQIYPIDQKKFKKAKNTFRPNDGVDLIIRQTGIGEQIILVLGGIEHDVTDYSIW